jgi:hypothetical protein
MQAKQTRFGLEIEVHVPQAHSAEFPVGGYHHGTQLPWAPAGWNGQHDGSISDLPGMVAVEIVSPILVGEEGLCQVVHVVNYLKEIGAVVDSSCGLHVHVDASELNPEQVASVKAQFRQYEKAFFGLSGEQAGIRWNNHFCARSEQWVGDTNRYQSLNVRNYGRHDKNTLEVRAWAATLEDTEVVAAISMAVALVVKASQTPYHITYQMTNTIQAVKGFCRDHFKQAECRIVPDAPIADIVLRAYHQSKKAQLR